MVGPADCESWVLPRRRSVGVLVLVMDVGRVIVIVVHSVVVVSVGVLA